MIWTDDDVLVDPNWLSEYVAASEQYPDAVFFGGTINPWFEEEPPRNIRDNLSFLQGPFVIRQLGSRIEPIDPNELPFGANMAFRTEFLKRFPFNPSLGICGQDRILGDEVDVMERLLRGGHKGIWVGSAHVRHYVPATRFSLDFLTKWYEGAGRSVARITPPDGKQLWGVPRWALRSYWQYRLQELASYCCNKTYWLRAYLRARRMHGFMQEFRRLRSNHAVLMGG